MPTPEQIRGQMYTAIAHGATGLWLFVQDTPWVHGAGLAGISPQVNSAQWQAAAQANREIAQYKKIFLSKTASAIYHLYYSTIPNVPGMTGPPLHTLLKDSGEPNTFYLLAVSQVANPYRVRFEFTKDISRVTSLFDGRNITLDSTKPKVFTDSQQFANYDTRLYKIDFGGASPPPTPTPTFTPAPSPTATPPPLPGDFNHDGRVDILDLRQLLANFTSIFDYNLLVKHFGR